jgi:hypothetical protein
VYSLTKEVDAGLCVQVERSVRELVRRSCLIEVDIQLGAPLSHIHRLQTSLLVDRLDLIRRRAESWSDLVALAVDLAVVDGRFAGVVRVRGDVDDLAVIALVQATDDLDEAQLLYELPVVAARMQISVEGSGQAVGATAKGAGAPFAVSVRSLTSSDLPSARARFLMWRTTLARFLARPMAWIAFFKSVTSAMG